MRLFYLGEDQKWQDKVASLEELSGVVTQDKDFIYQQVQKYQTERCLVFLDTSSEENISEEMINFASRVGQLEHCSLIILVNDDAPEKTSESPFHAAHPSAYLHRDCSKQEFDDFIEDFKLLALTDQFADNNSDGKDDKTALDLSFSTGQQVISPKDPDHDEEDKTQIDRSHVSELTNNSSSVKEIELPSLEMETGQLFEVETNEAQTETSQSGHKEIELGGSELDLNFETGSSEDHEENHINQDFSSSNISTDATFQATILKEELGLDDDSSDVTGETQVSFTATDKLKTSSEVDLSKNDDEMNISIDIEKDPYDSYAVSHDGPNADDLFQDRVASSENREREKLTSLADVEKSHSTVKLMREEREGLMSEIQNLKEEKRVTDQKNLNLRAEVEELRIELNILRKRQLDELEELNYRLRVSEEKKSIYEEKAKYFKEQLEDLGQKVRIDFNKVKQREKELENQLELIKLDAQAQIKSRDELILDLKRKIDQLEFNMENSHIREEKYREDKAKLEERMTKIMKTLRHSMKTLEHDLEVDEEILDGLKKL